MHRHNAPVDVNLTETELREIKALLEKKLKGVTWTLENKEIEDKDALEIRKDMQEGLLEKINRELQEEEKEEE